MHFDYACNRFCCKARHGIGFLEFVYQTSPGEDTASHGAVHGTGRTAPHTLAHSEISQFHFPVVRWISSNDQHIGIRDPDRSQLIKETISLDQEGRCSGPVHLAGSAKRTRLHYLHSTISILQCYSSFFIMLGAYSLYPCFG